MGRKISFKVMPKGVYKRTKSPWNKGNIGVYSEDTLKKMSESHKGQIPWHTGLKGVKPAWNKGKTGIYSEETLKKISDSKKGKEPWNKGKPMSEKSKNKLSNSLKEQFKKGRTVWNKNKKNCFSDETINKIKKSNKGNTPWNKGKTNIYSEETLKKMSASKKGKKFSNLSIALKGRDAWNKGKKGVQVCSRKGVDSRIKVKCVVCDKIFKTYNINKKYCSKKCYHEYNKGPNHCAYGKKLSKERIEKMRQNTIEQLSSGRLPSKRTKIELAMEKQIKKHNFQYLANKAMYAIGIPDFFLPDFGIIIECDGDYWHNLPGYKKRDERQNKQYKAEGYKVFRFWEHEINKNPEACMDQVLEFIKEVFA